MSTLDCHLVSVRILGISVVWMMVACGGDDASSSLTSDAERGAEASTGADVAAATDGGADEDSSNALDALNPQDAAEETTVDDSGQGADAADEMATEDGSAGDDSASSLDDGPNSADASMAGDQSAISEASADSSNDTTSAYDSPPPSHDAAIDTTGGDASGGVAAADSSSDAGSSNDTATTASDATSEPTLDPDASADAAADAPSDAGDVVAGPLLDYTFAASNESWWVQSTSPGSPSALASTSSVAQSSTFGHPAGSLLVNAGFDDSGEKVTVGITFTPPIDLTGRTISMDIFLAGGSQQFTYFYLFCQDYNWDWIDPGAKSFPAVPGGQWMNVTLDVSHPQGFRSTQFDTTRIALLGVEFDSGAGVGPGSITPVTAYIDNVVVQ